MDCDFLECSDNNFSYFQNQRRINSFQSMFEKSNLIENFLRKLKTEKFILPDWLKFPCLLMWYTFFFTRYYSKLLENLIQGHRLITQVKAKV